MRPASDAGGMSAEEIRAFIEAEFPGAVRFGAQIDAVASDRVIIRLPIRGGFLRPGETVSGPTLMTLADTAVYYLVLATVGPVALAFTTHLSIDFLRTGAPDAVLAEACALKRGKRLYVGRVEMWGGRDQPWHAASGRGPRELLAHATVTYSIPPR